MKAGTWFVAAAAALGALVALDADTAPVAPRSLALEDSEAIKSPDNPAISRDGKLVAYVADERIFVAPLAGGPPRAVTATGSSVWAPYWSKDGKALYFLSDRAKSGQLWKLPLGDFGEAQQLTTLQQGIDRIRFSPDESRLLLLFTDTQAGVKEGAAEEKAAAPFVITRLEFKEDAGQGYLTGDLAEHLHVLDLATGKLTQLTSGEYTESDADWSPDGRRIVFVSNREAEPDASYKTDLWVVAADNTDKV